tara:strand:+ start:447 stop:626 length:180 start_codon:yes stop_codon:yes gene_type:complete
MAKKENVITRCRCSMARSLSGNDKYDCEWCRPIREIAKELVKNGFGKNKKDFNEDLKGK